MYQGQVQNWFIPLRHCCFKIRKSMNVTLHNKRIWEKNQAMIVTNVKEHSLKIKFLAKHVYKTYLQSTESKHHKPNDCMYEKNTYENIRTLITST